LIDMEHYAGFWRRVLASIIDTLLFALIAGVIHFVFFGDDAINIIPMDAVNGFNFQVISSTNWLEQVIIILVTVFMWIKFLGTPGKLILGCQVVDAKTKQAMTPGQAVLRYFAYFVSLLPLGLGMFWIAWDKRKQGFHDKIAGTVVIVESSAAKPDKSDESQKTLQQLMSELR